jgi:hypothetical protein
MPQTTPHQERRYRDLALVSSASSQKVTGAYDGGRITSDGGVLLLAQAECGHCPSNVALVLSGC